MKRRDFIKKAGVGAVAVAATAVNAPFVHAGKKKIADFALDIYKMPDSQDDLRDRLIAGWVTAINKPNAVEEVYLLFQREGYDATYEECLKLVELYKEMSVKPPWGGPGSSPRVGSTFSAQPDSMVPCARRSRSCRRCCRATSSAASRLVL